MQAAVGLGMTTSSLRNQLCFYRYFSSDEGKVTDEQIVIIVVLVVV